MFSRKKLYIQFAPSQNLKYRFVFYLQDADGGIVEAPVTSSNFPMACFMTEKTYIYV